MDFFRNDNLYRLSAAQIEEDVGRLKDEIPDLQWKVRAQSSVHFEGIKWSEGFVFFDGESDGAMVEIDYLEKLILIKVKNETGVIQEESFSFLLERLKILFNLQS